MNEILFLKIIVIMLVSFAPSDCVKDIDIIQDKDVYSTDDIKQIIMMQECIFDVSDEETPKESTQSIKFAVLGDPHFIRVDGLNLGKTELTVDKYGRSNNERMAYALDWINSQDDIEFIIITGDIISGMMGYNIAYKQWEEYSSWKSQTTKPIYEVKGDHEMYNDLFLTYTEKSEYYKITKQGIDFIFLSDWSEENKAKEKTWSYTDEQLETLSNDLSTGNPSILISHYPTTEYPIRPDTERLYSIIESNDNLIMHIFGHDHRGMYIDDGLISYGAKSVASQYSWGTDNFGDSLFIGIVTITDGVIDINEENIYN